MHSVVKSYAFIVGKSVLSHSITHLKVLSLSPPKLLLKSFVLLPCLSALLTE